MGDQDTGVGTATQEATGQDGGGIYAAIGGSEAVTAAVDIFYKKVVDDPSLAGYFTGIDMKKLIGHQRAFLTAALGGPEIYAGRDLGAAHAKFKLSDADFDAVGGHLVGTLQELGVPAELIKQIGEKVEGLRPVIVTA